MAIKDAHHYPEAVAGDRHAIFYRSVCGLILRLVHLDL
jgi:hypothetical protein